jgi:hypothetical protein
MPPHKGAAAHKGAPARPALQKPGLHPTARHHRVGWSMVAVVLAAVAAAVTAVTYNPRGYLDIYYLLSPSGKIVDEELD